MNKFLTLCLGVLASHSAIAQNAPTATVTFVAKTDLGESIVGAEIRLTTFVRWIPGEASGQDIYDGPTGTTNSGGLVTLSVPCSRGEIQYGGYMKGYYPTEGLTFMFKRGPDGQWLPSNPTVEIVIKPILNPVPVFARRPEELRFPIYGQSIGFDLMKSDWVAPYGNGIVQDFVFVFKSDFKGVDAGFKSTLLLRFSNDGDGIQSVLVPPRGGSRLRLPRFAPEDGYKPELLLQRAKVGPTTAVVSDERESQNYFFRVRTQKQDGKILSALYGKISGNLEFWEDGEVRFAYYLNPEALSRNMEFDMNRNQIRGLRGYEAIRKP
jgi:hypothetical protein